MISITAFSTIGVVLGFLLVALPLSVLYRVDGKLFRQSVMVLVQLVGLGAIVAVCLHYLYLWNQWWCGLLLMAVVTVSSAMVCARRTRLLIPLLTGALSGTVVIGLVYLLVVLYGLKGMRPSMAIPVFALLAAATTVMTNRGLRAYRNARRSHPQLYEYLIGNGAKPLEALMPFVRKAFRQSYITYLQQLKTYYVIGFPALLCGMLMGGMSPFVSILLMLEMVIALLSSTAIALMAGMYLMERK